MRLEYAFFAAQSLGGTAEDDRPADAPPGKPSIIDGGTRSRGKGGGDDAMFMGMHERIAVLCVDFDDTLTDGDTTNLLVKTAEAHVRWACPILLELGQPQQQVLPNLSSPPAAGLHEMPRYSSPKIHERRDSQKFFLAYLPFGLFVHTRTARHSGRQGGSDSRMGTPYNGIPRKLRRGDRRGACLESKCAEP